MIKPLRFTLLLFIGTLIVPPVAWSYLLSGCTNTDYTPAQVTQAIQNSPYANSALKAQACAFGGASQPESGGNSCDANPGNTGVLQLNNKSIAAAGYTPQQYGSLPLQQQVNIWAQQVGNGNTSGAYGTLTNSLGSSINGVPITQGTLAACFQFGPVICKNDLATIQANGSCPAKGSGCTASPAGANRGNGTFCGASSAQLDDNGLSICTYAPKIQKQMSAANSSCDGASTTPSNTPTTNCPGTGTNPGGAISPSPGNAPVTLPANLA